MSITTVEEILALEDGARVALFPKPDNPLYAKPHIAAYSNGFFYVEGSPASDGPDYYYRDVLKYNERIEALE